MKHLGKITLVSVLLFAATSVSGLLAQQPRYKLVWKENFRGKEINEKYWTKIPRGGSDWNRHMSSHNSLYEVKKLNQVAAGGISKSRLYLLYIDYRK